MTQSVNELAEQLIKSGLAQSKSQALEMAESISSTGEKVRTDFEAKKESVSAHYEHRGQRPSGQSVNTDVEVPKQANPYADAKVKEMRQNAMENKPVEVQVDYETPQQSLNEAVGNEPAQDESAENEFMHELEEQETANDFQVEEPVEELEVPKPSEQPEEVVTENPHEEVVVQDEESPEMDLTEPETVKEEKKHPEEDVDLSDVFGN